MLFFWQKSTTILVWIYKYFIFRCIITNFLMRKQCANIFRTEINTTMTLRFQQSKYKQIFKYFKYHWKHYKCNALLYKLCTISSPSVTGCAAGGLSLFVHTSFERRLPCNSIAKIDETWQNYSLHCFYQNNSNMFYYIHLIAWS
jgi:hypothetical protein